MPPLKAEIFRPESDRWSKIGEIKPGEYSGQNISYKPDGKREIYLNVCEGDNSKSTIYRKVFDQGEELPTFNDFVANKEKLEVVKELRKGETYEREVRPTKNATEPIKLRLTHE